MKKLVCILLLILPLVTIAQTHLPDWFRKSFKANKLDQQYKLKAYKQPAFLSDDFDGDGNADVAALIIQKKTKMKGIIIMHGNTNNYFIIGAGTNFGNGGGDFYWIKGWTLYKDNFAYETLFPNSGSVRSKKIKLEHHGFLIYDLEDDTRSSGGIVYWSGEKYIWIHQYL
jgi:hypothetical protein